MNSMHDRDTQVDAYKRLLAAVVGLAVKDAQIKPLVFVGHKRRNPTPTALSALKFLFTSDSDGYLALLEIDPQQFRRRLLNQIFDSDNKMLDTTYRNRRNFRFNYIWYYKNRKKAEELLMRVVHDAAEDAGAEEI